MDQTQEIEVARKIADIIAIPFFILLIYFLWKIPEKNLLVMVLLIGAIVGLVLDSIFTINLIYGLKNKNLNLDLLTVISYNKNNNK